MSKLLDKILSRENMLEAYNQVKSNKGSDGIDGMISKRWIIISDKTGA
ncbi:Group II intron maturase [Streptococcus pneumoniae]|nr:Group II intron maturase [Streptococcus pneumoniae]